MGRHKIVLSSLAVFLLSASTALAQEEDEEGVTRLGLHPGEPQTRSAPPQVPLGIPPSQSASNVFDFHGFLQMPLTVGVLEREDPGENQGDVALHLPPQTPQHFRSFGWTGVIPNPWGQLNFSYGNKKISGTVILGTRAFADSEGVWNPADQLGVTDAFMTTNLSEIFDVPLELKLGAVTGRYGPMGMYDAGRYGTPLIARTNSIGETLTAAFPIGDDVEVVLEQGAGGQIAGPERSFVPAGYNGYADRDVGSSFVTHFHAGVGYKRFAQVGLHYLTALSADDRATDTTEVPDGRITVLGADMRLTAGRGGHFYFGFARTKLTESRVVSGVIEILNSRGGQELIDEYLGPDSSGNGSLTIFGGQYDLSMSRAIYGDLYQGVSPDLRLSLFGVGTIVESEDENFDGITKLKFGAEGSYSITKWFSAAARWDHVRPNNEINAQTYHMISPRLLFHTDWESRDEVALQYTRFIYGQDVVARTGFPPLRDPFAPVDGHVFVLSGTYWW